MRSLFRFFLLMLALLSVTNFASASDPMHTVALFHRVNVYPYAPDTATFETLLNEVTISGAKGTILSQWSKNFPFFSGQRFEDSIRARIDRALTRCDSAGISVWFEAQQLSKYSYGNPSSLPTMVKDTGVVYDLLSNRRLSSDRWYWDLTPPPGDYRLFYNLEVAPWRYYDFHFIASSKDRSARVTVGFYRWDEDTKQYRKTSYIDLTAGVNRIKFHSLESSKWQFIFFAQNAPLRVIPTRLVERAPDSTECFADMSPEEALFWSGDSTLPMYKCRPSEIGGSARHFNCNQPNTANKHALWVGYKVFIDQWKYLKSTGHPCLKGIFATGDEPTSGGYEMAVIKESGSIGRAFGDHVMNFCELGSAVTGSPVLIYADPFDPYHNGIKYNRANNPMGGGFSTAPATVYDDVPAIFLVWNEDKLPTMRKSIEYWANSGHEWVLAMHLEDKNHAGIADIIRELPVGKRPAWILWFTWDTREIRAEKLIPKFRYFAGLGRP